MKRLSQATLAAAVVIGTAAPLAAPARASDIHYRIVGGSDSSAQGAPWQVAVKDVFLGALCGGSIIGPSVIVTAAHCTPNDPTHLAVVAGQSTLSALNNIDNWRPVASVRVHPGYVPSQNGSAPHNDIAVLHLTRPLPLDGTTMATIALPTSPGSEWPAVGTAAQISGWGWTSTSDPAATTLQAATVPVVSAPGGSCASWPDTAFDPATMVCAGSTSEPAIDTCKGDSGGPLAINVNGTWVLAGVTSFGPEPGCGTVALPSVFTRVTAFLGWLQPGDDSGDGPQPWHQATARASVDDECADGWKGSWAQWPNDGQGGFTCERTLQWSNAAQAWISVPG